MKKRLFYFLFILICFQVHAQEAPLTLKVLQFNVWQEGTVVEGGFDAIVREVIRTDADLIALSEVRNYKGVSFADKLVKAFAAKGLTYYSQESKDSGILSRYPIVSQEALYPVQDDRGSVTKAIIQVKDKQVAFYSAHLDYRNCSYYLPRGYHSSTWKKLPQPVVDTAVIAADNLQSKRDEAIQLFLTDARREEAKGSLVLLAGDFNEPSYLDWTEATKNLSDHNGVVLPWHNTLQLSKAGYKDAYRVLYPDPVTHPGFTFPADNVLVDISKLAWSPDADDRERIDFVFYHPSPNIQLKDIKIIGPQGSIVRNQRKPETTEDPIETPAGVWPTDHKALLTTFVLQPGGASWESDLK